MSGQLPLPHRDFTPVRLAEMPSPLGHGECSGAANDPVSLLLSAKETIALDGHLEDTCIRLQHHVAPMEINYRAESAHAVLLLPLAGSVDLSGRDGRYRCTVNMPFLHAREDAIHAAWHPGSSSLVINFRKDRLNAAVSTQLVDGRRLTAVGKLLGCAGPGHDLEKVATALAMAALHQNVDGIAVEFEFYRALARRIVELNLADDMMPPVRIVSEAMRIVRADHAASFDNDRLATLVRVTADTLRKNFRACLGMTVKEYIQSVRLEWARERLSSGRESRAIAEIAQAAGFGATANFSRSYVHRFGEAPSLTRAEAVRRMS